MEKSSAKTDLYKMLISKDLQPLIKDKNGKDVSDPEEASMFTFDWKTPHNNYGTVVAMINQQNRLVVFFGDNLGRGMDPRDKDLWFGTASRPGFLEQLKQFAVSNNFRGFELSNLSKLKYTMQGMAAIKEGLFEGYYGKRDISYYADKPQNARLMIKHTHSLGENDVRYRSIDRLFVETDDGARYPLPFKNLNFGKAMVRHVLEGGTPYDTFGQYITGMVTEINSLAHFIRATKRRDFSHPDAHQLVEIAVRHYQDLKNKARKMIHSRGYLEEKNNFDPATITDGEIATDSIRDLFVEQRVDSRIEEALPALAALAGRAALSTATAEAVQPPPDMRELNEFQTWMEDMTTRSVDQAVEPKLQKQLQNLLSQPLIVGADAINATEQLYDILPDEELFNRLEALAAQDANANAWADPEVIRRMSELGISVDNTAAEPVEPEQAEPVEPEQADDQVAADIDQAVGEALDSDGIMMTRPSNMSSEGREYDATLLRLIELSAR